MFGWGCASLTALSAKLFLDLHTMLAPSGEERPLNAAAQVERARWCCRRFDSGTQTRCGSATVMVLVSTASGPRVSGCIRAPLYFHPYPVSIHYSRGIEGISQDVHDMPRIANDASSCKPYVLAAGRRRNDENVARLWPRRCA